MPVGYMVIGSSGLLGRSLLARLGDEAAGMDLPELDVREPRSVAAMLREHNPAVLLNCAAITDVDRCEALPAEAYRVHRDGVANLASRCGSSRLLVTFSTDHVFGGPGGRERLEEDEPAPSNAYARSKLEGEAAAAMAVEHLVVRTSWLYGDAKGLVPWIWDRLERDEIVRAVADQVGSLTFVDDLVEGLMNALSRGLRGVLHLSNRGPVSVLDLARRMAVMAGRDPARVEAVRWRDLGVRAPRPAYSALASSRGIDLPAWVDGVRRWLELRQ